MRFSHHEETRENRLLDILTDETNGLRVIVSRLGAELISIARRNASGVWIGFLNRDNDLSAPASGWANHATVMGYFLHRLKDERSRYRGHEIHGATHGFLRRKTWQLAAANLNAGALTYRLTSTNFTSTEYPLNVSLDLTYEIIDSAMRTTFRFTNAEPELTAHLEFGLHPGFAATSFDSFHFRMPPGLYRRHFSPGNYLSGETEDIDFPGGEMPFDRAKLPDSFILELLQTDGRDFAFDDPPSGRSVFLDTGSAPYLTLWSDGGAFLCVEPCWGLTDHHDQRAFQDKEGIQRIAPGGTLEASFVIAPQLGNS